MTKIVIEIEIKKMIGSKLIAQTIQKQLTNTLNGMKQSTPIIEKIETRIE